MRQIIGFPWRLIGLLPLAASIFFNLIAYRVFKTHDTTVKLFEDSNALVTTGVFGISRNPMYFGTTLIMLWLTLLLGSVTPFAVVIVLPVLFDITFIGSEEHMLEESWDTCSGSTGTVSEKGYDHIVQQDECTLSSLARRSVINNGLR